MGVLIRALSFGVYIRARHSCKLPCLQYLEQILPVSISALRAGNLSALLAAASKSHASFLTLGSQGLCLCGVATH